jgi:hypothetical protein
MRTEIAIISALTLVLSVPLAFGEIVETKGQNYDLVENFFIGEAVWESHPERIMDGGWQNYALSNTGDKVIFNTNAVGSFVFDKNSCSYSIYGNGFDGEQIIPSVSAVATYLNNGQWQNLPINDEACIVEVSEYEDGVFLTSTKVITEDITEDVFIPYTGTTENFYVNATNANFDLIQLSNGTNIGYFNGETRILESVEVEKFVQEIKLDINSGFKETFKVWHDGDEQLGISQTIHSGESITIADQTINIAELNGQSFDRQFIIDNEAEILALTDSVNYDFDIGIDSLSNINIIFDGDYKVNMDFASGNFVGYLEIDPTLTTTGSGTFDITPLHNHDISSGTIDSVSLTATQITNLQNDINAFNQYHTLSGNTLIVSYTVPTVPQPPTGLTTVAGIPLELDWSVPIDDGDSSITGYKVFRTDNQYAKTELPNNSANSNGIDFTDNEFLIQGFETNGNLEDKSINSITVTQTNPSTFTNGIIGNGVQSPDLSFTNTNIPDGVDDFTVSSWIKLDSTPTNTEILKLNDITFNVDSTSASISGQTTGTTNAGAWGTSVSNDNTDLKADSSNWSETAFEGFTGSATVTSDKVQWGTGMSTSNSGNIWYGSERIISGSVWESVMTGDWNWDIKMDTGSARYHMLKTEIHFNDGKWLGTLNYATTSGGTYVRVVDQNGYTHVGGNPFYPEFSKVGNLYKVCKPSTNVCKQVTTSSGIDYISIKGAKNNSYGNNAVIYTESVELSGQHTGIIDFDIITATGLTSNTVDPQMYTFTRSGNDFKIYQNAILESSATDSTSLGSNSGQDYTINLDGMIDEYFIDSTALTSTEIDTIYDNSKDLTPLATSTTNNYDDNTVVAGNTYYYSVSSVNSIGNSVYVTPFVSGLGGTPPDVPTSVSSTINSPNTAPLDITVSWSAPTNVGTGTLTGFEIYRDSTLITTTGLVSSYTDTVPTGGGTFEYKLKAVSTHGTSGFSSTTSTTTPTVPPAPTNATCN